MTERRWRREEDEKKVFRRRKKVEGEGRRKMMLNWNLFGGDDLLGSTPSRIVGMEATQCLAGQQAHQSVSQSVSPEGETSQSWGRNQTVLDRLSWTRRNKERNNKTFSKACLKEKSTARIFFWEMYFLLELTSLVVNVRIFNMYLFGSCPTPRGCKKRIYLFIEPALSLLTFDLCLREASSSTGHLMILTLCNQIHSCL